MVQPAIQASALTSELKQDISSLLQSMVEAWDAGDAAAYARLFTEDATYVMFLGIPAFGRDEIERMHIPVFEQWQRGSRMKMRILGARQVGSEVVVVLTEGGVGTGDAIPFDKVQTYTLVRTNEGWRCAAFQNTAKSETNGGLPRQ